MSTTKHVVDAIHSSPYRRELPLEACLSLPIPMPWNGMVILAAFWHSVGGPFLNRKTSAPYCRTLADPEHLGDIRFHHLQPGELGIDASENTALGRPTIGGSVLPGEVGQVWEEFYQATDRIIVPYARAVISQNFFPNEAECAEITAYRAAFHRIAIVALLPAYCALSPRFFAWMGAVIGPEL